MQFDPIHYKKPQGKEGEEVIESMNVSHRPLTEWAMSHFPPEASSILDIGCGGGMSIGLLADKYEGSKITGLDHSADAVRMSLENNSGLVEGGRCEVIEGSVSDMPFDDGSFDLVTAFETYFFWPDQENDIRKAGGLVAPGGTLAIVSEVDLTPDNVEEVKEYRRIYGMKILDSDTMVSILESCGLEPSVVKDGGKGWVTYLGHRPSA